MVRTRVPPPQSEPPARLATTRLDPLRCSMRSFGLRTAFRMSAIGALVHAGCSDGGDDPPTSAMTSAASSDGASDETGSETEASFPLVELRTTAGNLVLEMRPDLAPATVDNFLAYAQSGFYDGSDGDGATIIHRVVPGFVVQGGGLRADMSSKSTMPPVVSEGATLDNDRGTIAMAQIPGDPDSATSQFFINVTDNPELDADPAFTVFATVALGMELVDEMSGVDTQTVAPHENVPVEPIVIEAVVVP